ncbi:MAG: hypothetical protein IJN32_10640, partial [Thermoguttaceae bacterium]|nr:hypothetical protein [Thermoguttaceae bacterium]
MLFAARRQLRETEVAQIERIRDRTRPPAERAFARRALGQLDRIAVSVGDEDFTLRAAFFQRFQ